jgi:hypothetical protein
MADDDVSCLRTLPQSADQKWREKSAYLAWLGEELDTVHQAASNRIFRQDLDRAR